jgi:hypothetical protein
LNSFVREEKKLSSYLHEVIILNQDVTLRKFRGERHGQVRRLEEKGDENASRRGRERERERKRGSDRTFSALPAG